jgi:hypothetical protein
MRTFVRLISFMASVALLAASVSAADTVKSIDLGRSVSVIGRLGQPLGRIFQIEGIVVESTYRRSKADEGALLFRVTTVQGKALSEPTVIEMSFFASASAKKLAPGERRIFTGHETGGFTGIPDETHRHFAEVPAATGYGFTTQFVILK